MHPSHKLLLASVGLFCLSISSAGAQTSPLTPSEPHEALTFFEGSWTTEERPAESRFVETCKFLNAGRRHMICHSRWHVPSGQREGISIFSYNEADSTYLYYGLRPGGLVEQLRGRRLKDGWVFESAAGKGDPPVRSRVTISTVAPGRFKLVAESATGDGPWQVEGTEHYRPLNPKSP